MSLFLKFDSTMRNELTISQLISFHKPNNRRRLGLVKMPAKCNGWCKCQQSANIHIYHNNTLIQDLKKVAHILPVSVTRHVSALLQSPDIAGLPAEFTCKDRVNIPIEFLSSIRQLWSIPSADPTYIGHWAYPFSPRVRIANLIFGNLESIRC
jgi:hypothetical protein|uniref:Uncharacterized protein n=1 Tax=Zea mays TaxID=4577 RepID=A0A804LV10_MAIZE